MTRLNYQEKCGNQHEFLIETSEESLYFKEKKVLILHIFPSENTHDINKTQLKDSGE